MPESSNEYRLDFVVKDGIAKGYRVTLTQQNIDHHIQKYAEDRPELQDPDFIVKDVVEAMENPDLVYPGIFIDSAAGTVKTKKNIYVFYKEKVDRRYTKDGVVIKHYVRVIVRKLRFRNILEIVTPFYSARINEEKKCQPITQI